MTMFPFAGLVLHGFQTTSIRTMVSMMAVPHSRLRRCVRVYAYIQKLHATTTSKQQWGNIFSRHSAQPDFPCHVGSGDRTASVGMRRGLLRSLVSFVVGCFFAGNVQGEPGPRVPHVQWGNAAVLYSRLRATCSRLGLAPALLPARPSLPPSGVRFSCNGRGLPDDASHRKLGGPATRALGPHAGPTQAVLQYLLEGGDAALHEVSGASGRTPAALMAHLLADATAPVAATPRPATTAARRRGGRQ